jgi:hypothetical protein
MTFIQDLEAVIQAYVTRSASFRIGDLQVTVTDVGGKPAGIPVAAIFMLAYMALVSHTGTFQSGVITITVAPWVPAS